MRIFELLELLGVSPKAERSKVLVWIAVTMATAFIALIVTGQIAARTENPAWLLIFIGVGLVAYLIGRHYGIIESGRNRSGLKDMAKIYVRTNLIFTNTKQPLGKFAFWRVLNYLIAIAFTVILFKLLTEGGDLRWMLAVIPVYVVFYLIGRRFGHFR